SRPSPTSNRMKLSLLIALFLCNLAFAQDCVNCQPKPWWLRIFDWRILPVIPVAPPLIEIEKPELERDLKASYCRRNEDVVDTIVLHHTETGSSATIQDINQMHLNRGTSEDPWLMIAYHYTVNSAYPGSSNPKTKVSQGRPFEIAGSHAGTGVYKPAPQATVDLMKQDGVMQCGLKDGPLTEADDKFNAAGEVKANYNTVAIVVIGNYAKKSSANPGGYSANSPRYPTKETIATIAKLSCQIQREHPRVTNIKWHNYYKSTSCPGLIKDRIEQIKIEAEKYGCKFN
ncbi:MAG: peptidoglycan recognition protein family protein, partial [Bacteriovoracaceae bacterium]|nr:peptidoglycan recognition protein family protein [Bacteriovoracaceae bacterium]